MEADLIRTGLRLRDVGAPWFTWRDLLVIAVQSDQRSAIYRALNPETHMWGQIEHLAALAVDALHVLTWQNSSDGQKGRNRPKPLPRPGVEEAGKRRVKGTAVPISEIDSRLQKALGGNQGGG